MHSRSNPKSNVPTNKANISMQEQIDNYLFKNLTSPNPVLSNDGNYITIYKEGGDIKLERTGNVRKYAGGTLSRFSSEGIEYDVKFTNLTSNNPKIGNERRASVELMLRARLNKTVCNVLNSRIIDAADKLAILIPVMEYNLSMIQTSELDIVTKKDILDQIRSQMNCIINLNDRAQIESNRQNRFKFSYLKLKPSNVLLTVKNGKFIVNLGGIGNIVERNLNEPGTFKSSYPILNDEGEYSRVVNSNIVNGMRYIFGLFSYLFVNDLFGDKYENNYTPTDDELSTLDYELVNLLDETYSGLFFSEGISDSMN